MSNTDLHSAVFDICRLCLIEPESNRSLKFVDVFQHNLVNSIFEIFGIVIEYNGIKPKIMCYRCYSSLLAVQEMKKKLQENQKSVDYIAKKMFGHCPPRDTQLIPTSNPSEDSR